MYVLLLLLFFVHPLCSYKPFASKLYYYFSGEKTWYMIIKTKDLEYAHTVLLSWISKRYRETQKWFLSRWKMVSVMMSGLCQEKLKLFTDYPSVCVKLDKQSSTELVTYIYLINTIADTKKKNTRVWVKDRKFCDRFCKMNYTQQVLYRNKPETQTDWLRRPHKGTSALIHYRDGCILAKYTCH